MWRKHWISHVHRCWTGNFGWGCSHCIPHWQYKSNLENQGLCWKASLKWCFCFKVTQVLCSAINKPPQGCLQYHTGVTGQVRSFNFLTSSTYIHLANQFYKVFCTIMKVLVLNLDVIRFVFEENEATARLAGLRAPIQTHSKLEAVKI